MNIAHKLTLAARDAEDRQLDLEEREAEILLKALDHFALCAGDRIASSGSDETVAYALSRRIKNAQAAMMVEADRQDRQRATMTRLTSR